LGSPEHHAELEGVDALLRGRDEDLHVLEDSLFALLFRHLDEDLCLVVRVLDELDRLDDRLRSLELTDELLALLLIVPEVGLALGLLDLFVAGYRAFIVKETPSAAAADWSVPQAGL